MSRYTRFSGKIENSVYLTRVSFLCVSDSATYSSGVVRWMDDCRSRSSGNNLCSGIWRPGWKKRKDWKVAAWRKEGRYKTFRVENPDFEQWNHPTFRIYISPGLRPRERFCETWRDPASEGSPCSLVVCWRRRENQTRFVQELWPKDVQRGRRPFFQGTRLQKENTLSTIFIRCPSTKGTSPNLKSMQLLMPPTTPSWVMQLALWVIMHYALWLCILTDHVFCMHALWVMKSVRPVCQRLYPCFPRRWRSWRSDPPSCWTSS